MNLNPQEKLFIDICKDGNITKALKMLNDGLDPNLGLFGACQGNKKKLIEIMIAKGANNFNYGLRGAVLSGNKELVLDMINRGGREFDRCLFKVCIDYQTTRDECVYKYSDKNDKVFTEEYFKKLYSSRQIALLLLEKGANIATCQIILDYDDIYYLVQRGFKKFGTYTKIADKCREFIQEYNLVLKDVILVEDVRKLMIEY